MEDTDIALMARIKKGDEKAFEVLVARHQRPVYNLANRFLNDEGEAEDIVQEVFLRLYRAAKTYSPQAKFTTWLYTIVKNLCFNVLRKKRLVQIVSLDDETVPEIASHSADPSEILSRAQLKAKVIRAVCSLPPGLRMAVILQKFHGLSCEEIAKILECSPNAVKLRVHRAKQYLAQELGGVEEETK